MTPPSLPILVRDCDRAATKCGFCREYGHVYEDCQTRKEMRKADWHWRVMASLVVLGWIAFCYFAAIGVRDTFSR